MWDEVRAPPGAQHSASLKAITARQLQALVRRHARSPSFRRNSHEPGPSVKQHEPHGRPGIIARLFPSVHESSLGYALGSRTEKSDLETAPKRFVECVVE